MKNRALPLALVLLLVIPTLTLADPPAEVNGGTTISKLGLVTHSIFINDSTTTSSTWSNRTTTNGSTTTDTLWATRRITANDTIAADSAWANRITSNGSLVSDTSWPGRLTTNGSLTADTIWATHRTISNDTIATDSLWATTQINSNGTATFIGAVKTGDPKAPCSAIIEKSGSTITARTPYGATISTGTNAGAVIQTALDGLQSPTAGTLCLTNGTYTLTQPIRMRNGTTLLGTGLDTTLAASSIVETATETAAVMIYGNTTGNARIDNVSIRHIKVQLTGANTIDGITVNAGDDIIVDDVNMYASGGAEEGIAIYGSNRVLVNQVAINGFANVVANYQIDIADTLSPTISSTNVTIQNVILNNATGGPALSIRGAENITVNGLLVNNAKPNPSGQGGAINLQPDTDVAWTPTRNITISNCLIIRSSSWGITLDGVQDTLISNCYIDSPTKSGVHIHARTESGAPSNIRNTFTGVQVWRAGERGIRGDGQPPGTGGGPNQDTRINNCVLQSNQNEGIFLDDTIGVSITNCRIENNGLADATNGYGIFIQGSTFPITKDVTITSNQIVNNSRPATASNARDGIILTDMINAVVSNNIVIGSGRHGITVNRAKEWVVSGNICKNNGQKTTGHGIQVLGTTTTQSTNGIINANRCYDDQSSKTQSNGINVGADNLALLISSNYVTNNSGAGMNIVGTHTIRNNVGGVAEQTVTYGATCTLNTVYGAVGSTTQGRIVFGSVTLAATAVNLAKIEFQVETAAGSGTYVPRQDARIAATDTVTKDFPFNFYVAPGLRYQLVPSAAAGVTETVTSCNTIDL